MRSSHILIMSFLIAIIIHDFARPALSQNLKTSKNTLLSTNNKSKQIIEHINQQKYERRISKNREYLGLTFVFMTQQKSAEFLPTSPNLYTELIFATNMFVGIKPLNFLEISIGINVGMTQLAGDGLFDLGHYVEFDENTHEYYYPGEAPDDPYLASIDQMFFYSLFLKPRLNIISFRLNKSRKPEKLIFSIFTNFQYYSMTGNVDESPPGTGWYSWSELKSHNSKMTGILLSYGIGIEYYIASNGFSLYLDTSYGVADNIVTKPKRVWDGRLTDPFRLVGDYLSFEFGFKIPINLFKK